MKRLLLLTIAVASVLCADAQVRIGGRNVRVDRAVQAAADVATAVTLSDEDVAMLCREAIEWMDAHNPIAGEDTEYGARLNRLVGHITEMDGMPLNFKVYHVVDINAFACGDGSIRVFSSLMDIMDDDELMAIIGHEIGHIVNSDVKDAIRTAYLASAARNAASAAGGTVGKLSDSELGDLMQAFTSAQFSQKQEYAADDYGFRFCIKNGYDPYGMANSLWKLVELSQSERASAVDKMFSSHPDSEKRSLRIRETADGYMSGRN